MQDDPIVTAEEAAAILRVNVRTIHRMIVRGELPATKVARRWKIRKSEVLRQIAPESAPVSSSSDTTDAL